VLAIDDWAWRRGQSYGTILVDLERNRVVDLLPDRETGTVSAWLQRHGGIEAVARDRAGAYADAVRQGAPDALQVADRWHLLRNLGTALQGAVDRHRGAVRQAARAVSDGTTSSPEPPPRLGRVCKRRTFRV
jgi:transposase